MQETQIVEINKGLILSYNHLIPVVNGELIYIEKEADIIEYVVLGQSTRIDKIKNKAIKRIVVEVQG